MTDKEIQKLLQEREDEYVPKLIQLRREHPALSDWCLLSYMYLQALDKQRTKSRWRQIFHGASTATGTSFHDVTINATYEQLVDIFGKPSSPGDFDKVHAEWVLQSNEGVTCTIYDWKEPQDPHGHEKAINWHIGAHGPWGDVKAVEESNDLRKFVEAQLKD